MRSSRHLISVVLPAPLAPTRPKASPRATSRSTRAERCRLGRNVWRARDAQRVVNACSPSCLDNITPVPQASASLKSRTFPSATTPRPAGAARHQPGDPARRGGRHHGPVGLRQDHAAAHDHGRAAARSAAACACSGARPRELDARRRCTPCAARWACCSSSAPCSPTCRSTRTSPSRCASTPTCPSELLRDLVLMKLEAVGLRGARAPDAGRALRRHGAARGARALDRARPAADPVRRAVHRPRPDLASASSAPDPRA